jgi:hypothetical protein
LIKINSEKLSGGRVWLIDALDAISTEDGLTIYEINSAATYHLRLNGAGSQTYQEAVAINGVKILKNVEHLTNPGIETIYYEYAKKARDPKVVSSDFKQPKTPKTIYDTDYISHDDILKYGQIASAKAYNKVRIDRFDNRTSPIKDQVREAQLQSGGIDFSIYFDQNTGTIVNSYHPQIPGLPNRI